MSLAKRHSNQRFSWTDYRSWPDDERWELIDGVAFAMAPAPTTGHQMVVGQMFRFIGNALAGKPCQPFVAPTDVRLSEFDVVEPDVLVVCDPAKVTPSHIEGAPDVVIEVLSPSTASRDLREKKALYEKHGVAEYVVVDPSAHYAIRFLRAADGLFDKGTVFGGDETLVFGTLDGLGLALWEVFGLPAPVAANSGDESSAA